MPQASLTELLTELRAAKRRMNPRNPDVLLLTKCQAAIIDLAHQLHAAKQAKRSKLRGWLARWMPRRTVRV